MTTPLLSIVIPAYNEESRLPETLERIQRFLETQSYAAEVVVVENGSCDRTLEIARDFAANHAGFLAMHEERRGKGRAVRSGMLAASGEYRFICDADLSMPIEQVNRFLPPQQGCIDIAIASREAPGAVRYNEPAYRHLTGRVFNTLVRWLALPGLQDTQCGFKCFRDEVVKDVFPRQTIDGWTFDVEVLYIARQRGYNICEIPIDWYFNPESKVRVLHDSWRMFKDLLRIRANGRRGSYDAASRAG